MSELVKRVGVISAADFIRLFVKTLIGIALARILTQADYGTYRQLFMVYTLLFSIFMIGLPQSIYYFIPKSDAVNQKKFLRQSLDLFTILGLLCSIILLVFRKDVGQLFHNPELHKVIILYAFYPFFMFVSQLYYYAMIGMQQTRKAALFMIFSVCSDLILVLGAAIITRNLTYVIIGIMISVLVQWFYARIKLNPFCAAGKAFKFDKELLKSQLAYSLPIGISSIIGVVSSQLDKLIVSASHFSLEQFAVYSIGAAELPFIFIIANSVNAVILPEMNRCCNNARISGLYRSAIRKNALILFPLFAVCFIFAPHIIQILYSTKYLGAVTFFRIYLLSMPLRIATYSILFQVYNQTKYIFAISSISLILNAALSVILINMVGIRGPAISTTIVTYITVILYLVLMRSKLKLRISDLFPNLAMLRTVLTVIVASILCYPILFVRISSFGQILLGWTIFFASYYLLGNVFKAILPYDNEMVNHLLHELIGKLKGLFTHA